MSNLWRVEMLTAVDSYRPTGKKEWIPVPPLYNLSRRIAISAASRLMHRGDGIRIRRMP